MSTRISDSEAEQLLAGMTPAGRPELTDLAAAIGGVRSQTQSVAAPAPNAVLLTRLLGETAVPISNTGDATLASRSTADHGSPHVVRRPALIEGVRKMFEWIAGIGLVAKIALGTGVALAAATGVGAAGALPGPVQTVFDSVVSTVTGTEEVTDDDSAPSVDDEVGVNDDTATVVDDESDLNDDQADVSDDESDVSDDESDVSDDVSDSNDDDSDAADDASEHSDDDSDAGDDAAPSVDDEVDAGDDAAPSTDDVATDGD